MNLSGTTPRALYTTLGMISSGAGPRVAVFPTQRFHRAPVLKQKNAHPFMAFIGAKRRVWGVPVLKPSVEAYQRPESGWKELAFSSRGWHGRADGQTR